MPGKKIEIVGYYLSTNAMCVVITWVQLGLAAHWRQVEASERKQHMLYHRMLAG